MDLRYVLCLLVLISLDIKRACGILDTNGLGNSAETRLLDQYSESFDRISQFDFSFLNTIPKENDHILFLLPPDPRRSESLVFVINHFIKYYPSIHISIVIPYGNQTESVLLQNSDHAREIPGGSFSVERLLNEDLKYLQIFQDDALEQDLNLRICTRLNAQFTRIVLNKLEQNLPALVFVDSYDFGALSSVKEVFPKHRILVNHLGLLAGFSIPFQTLLPFRLPLHGALRESSWTTRLTQPSFYVLSYFAHRSRLQKVNDARVQAGLSPISSFDELYEHTTLLVNTKFGIEYRRSESEMFELQSKIYMTGPLYMKPDANQVHSSTNSILIAMHSVLGVDSTLLRSIRDAACNLEVESIEWVVMDRDTEVFFQAVGEIPCEYSPKMKKETEKVVHSKVHVIHRASELNAILDRGFDAFVSSCDLDAVQSAILHEVPSVCIPLESDQGDLAHKLEDGGLGIRVSVQSAESNNGKEVSKAVGRIRAPNNAFSIRVKRMKQVFEVNSGMSIIERLVKQVLNETLGSEEELMSERMSDALLEWYDDHCHRQQHGAEYESVAEFLIWFAPSAVGIIGPLFAIGSAVRVYVRLAKRGLSFLFDFGRNWIQKRQPMTQTKKRN
uniref:Uncharacterized protein n=1 Tax=Timspurckia oligopyrenoides TaxID=708627 RepID=A0A7S0ZCY1_9RHOD|mmetsp:Transcript_12907/g.23198  ORF Transcript_12907/g.23198 Transcript_12907/m.23198 type:complete len:616 (+) Transcript_12907:1-1848(+)